MELGVFMTNQQLTEYTQGIVQQTVKTTMEEIRQSGGLQEPLPDRVSTEWVAKKYGISTQTVRRWRDRIVKQYGTGTTIVHKEGNTIFFNRRKLDAWLMGERQEKEARKKLDPRLEA